MKLSDYLPLGPGENRVVVYRYMGEYYAMLIMQKVSGQVLSGHLGAEVEFVITRRAETDLELAQLIEDVRKEAKSRGIAKVNNLDKLSKGF